MINGFAVVGAQLMDGSDPRDGFFFAGGSGKKLGNFDVIYDPASNVQVLAGQLTSTGKQFILTSGPISRPGASETERGPNFSRR